MRFSVSMVGRIEVTGVPGEAAGIIEQHLDDVMDELLSLGTEDPSIDVHLPTGEVEFVLIVEASNPISAIPQGSGLLRTAIHAAGGCTPDWPNEDHPAWSIQLVDVRSSELPAEKPDEKPEGECHPEPAAPQRQQEPPSTTSPPSRKVGSTHGRTSG